MPRPKPASKAPCRNPIPFTALGNSPISRQPRSCCTNRLIEQQCVWICSSMGFRYVPAPARTINR
jgi:hypothetical protein